MMGEKTYPVCTLGRTTICLGQQMDHEVSNIRFDVHEWLDSYPKATVAGFAMPPSGEGYPITLTMDNGIAVWTIRDSDTATAGRGMVQLVLLGENGEKLHSANALTMISASVAASAGTTPPNAAKPWFEELLEKIRQLEENGVTDEQIADALEEYLKEHPVGGVKPEDVEEAVRAALQEAKESGDFKGEPGNDGEDGFSPVVTVTAISGGHRVSITDENGTKTFNVMNGSDGVSPTIAVTTITGGHRVTITDVNGTQSFDVADGKDGVGGEGGTGVDGGGGGYYIPSIDTNGNLSWSASKAGMPSVPSANIKGADGTDGEDGVSVTHSWNGTTLTVTSKSGTSSANLKGEPGDDGKNYVLNDADKQEIAGIAADMVEVPEAPTVELDTTLTQSGKAADAKATGDAINELKEANAKQDEAIKALEQAGGIVTVEPAEDDVPIVFFGGDLPQTKTDTVMPFKYVSKTKTVGGYVETKAQGNSSMNYPKKNQTVKMYADEALEDSVKVDFKGWGAQKKHVYKANWIDLTHARNIVSAQLWGDVVKSRANYLDLPELLRTSPNQGAVDGFPALVYANGVYQGRYTINIPKDAWMANMDDGLDEHCILCGENYVSGCFRAAANINGSDWSDEVHDTVPAAIKTRWNEIISFVMNSTDDEFVAGIGNYFYLDSLIDYYIFGVVSCGLDAFGKNQLYMTYDGQKWIASMYDMDSTWGLWWNGGSFVASTYARTEFQDFKDGEGNLLYIRLEELFYEQIQARWAELKDTVLSYANIMTRFERFIGIVPPHIVKEDFASTTGGGKFTGIPSKDTNHIQQLRAYVAARLPYADGWFASLTPAVQIPCTGITLDQNTLTFTAEGTQTLTAAVTPNNTTDTVAWSTDTDTVATVSGGVVTAVGNGNATITATCGSYSATCAVSVSGISTNEPSTAAYEITDRVFNGTSDYVDTGIALFDTAKDFTMFIDFTDGYTENPTTNTVIPIVHCIRESGGYPGFTIHRSFNKYEFQMNGGYRAQAAGYDNANGITTKFVTRRSGNNVIWREWNSASQSVQKGTGSTTLSDVTQNMLLGAYQTIDGTKGRFWKGTVNRCVIWLSALGDEEIEALFAN